MFNASAIVGPQLVESMNAKPLNIGYFFFFFFKAEYDLIQFAHKSP
jgi:hypothetical protein